MNRNKYDKSSPENKRVTSVMKKSLYLVFFMILAFCGVLIARLVYLNNVNGDRYAKAVLSQQSYSSTTVKSERGRILDRNGVVLARSEKVYNTVIDARVILSHDYYVEPTLDAIEKYLGYDKEEIRGLINEKSDSSYIVYEHDVDYARVSEFTKALNASKYVVGVWFEEEYRRTYPYGDLASHVIGFTMGEGNGSYGIEEYYNDLLTGTDGVSLGYFDSELSKRNLVKEPINGDDVVSTIDYNIQTVVQDKVSEFIEETGCNNIGVIVMNPNNGEIYAMASNREFDLNNPRDLSGYYSEEELVNLDDSVKLNTLYSIWRNYCVSDTYEPGSTYKTITVAAALEEDSILTTDTFECEGYTEVGGWKIGCNNKDGHGTLSLAEALMRSCNCALMDIASRLGPDEFYDYQQRFGFGRKTGIDLTGESSGIVIDRKNLNVTELATSSFGTTFNVTMVQMAGAYASIVNGGKYYTPHIVSEIRNGDGTGITTVETPVVRRTVSESTAKFIRNALYKTVEAGTATPAKIDGYLIAGKTGTAQKRPREEKKYVVSFAGFTPVDDPQVLVYVVIDEIHDPEKSSSSTPASGMTASILKEILPYLGLYPEGDIEYSVDLTLIGDDCGVQNDEANPDVLPEGLDGDF